MLLAFFVVIGSLTRENARSHPGADSNATQAPPPVAARPALLIQPKDRLAWVGSSSTRIGIWPKTVEFLLKTRHPSLDLSFQSFSTGGGTFQTGVENLDAWLEDFRPSLVVLNYGGNDAGSGFHGLSAFRDRMGQCVAKIHSRGSRTILVTPQAADLRKSGREPAAKRALYADVMLDHGREQGWSVIDVHEPLAALQRSGSKADPDFSILKDRIHLTHSAYVAWGFYFYDRLDLPRARSAAMLNAQGKVVWSTNCEIREVSATEDVLAFTRTDRILPILPPGPLPPRELVPMESNSVYRLRVVGLKPGSYEIRCDGKPLGETDEASLALGIDLNSLLLDSGNEAPWASLAKEVWEGRTLPELGKTPWRYEVRRLPESLPSPALEPKDAPPR